jgi:ribonuclease HI
MQTCGGILRDSNRCFIFLFAARMHQLSVIEAELWRIYYWLKLTWERGFRKIKVYSDSLIAIRILKDGCPLTHPHRTLVENEHQIHQNERSVDWIHVL